MGYVYGIYADNLLVYIGKTTRTLEERFKEHKQAVESDKENVQKIHKLIRKYKSCGVKFTMRELGTAEDKDSLRYLEQELIYEYQPIGNVEGIIKY